MGVKALAEFLKVDPTDSAARQSAADAAPDPMNRLGAVLAEVGEEGLSAARAMKLSGLDRSDFLSALATASKLNLVETVDRDGESRLRLTESARSLY